MISYSGGSSQGKLMKEQHKENTQLTVTIALFAAIFAIASGLSSATFSKLFELYPWMLWIGVVGLLVIAVGLYFGLNKINLKEDIKLMKEE